MLPTSWVVRSYRSSAMLPLPPDGLPSRLKLSAASGAGTTSLNERPGFHCSGRSFQAIESGASHLLVLLGRHSAHADPADDLAVDHDWKPAGDRGDPR